MEEIYLPQERAILCDYFRIDRPAGLVAIDVETRPAANGAQRRRAADSRGEGRAARESSGESTSETTGDDAGLVLVEPDMNDEFTEFSLPNAVARIALARIQHRLPQWGAVLADGTLILGRRLRKSSARRVTFLPQHLFTINWADSGPGFSWPEAYHVTYLPGFDRYVVTASQDSPDTYGYSEFAIGSFPASTEIKDGAKKVIIDWWAEARAHEHSGWESFWDRGLITKKEALAWRQEAWSDPDEEDDDEWEDDEDDDEDEGGRKEEEEEEEEEE